MKTLPKKHCTVAGVTSDGVTCYYGKKDSGNPLEFDLTLWVTCGLPKVDGSNYTRLSAVGYDERLAWGTPPVDYTQEGFDALEKERLEGVKSFLAGVSSGDLKRASLGSEN